MARGSEDVSRRSRIEVELRDFIVAELLDDEVGNGVDPLAADAVDSLGLEQLVEYIVREFDVALEDEDMVRRNFASVAALAALVDSKLREPA